MKKIGVYTKVVTFIEGDKRKISQKKQKSKKNSSVSIVIICFGPSSFGTLLNLPIRTPVVTKILKIGMI